MFLVVPFPLFAHFWIFSRHSIHNATLNELTLILACRWSTATIPPLGLLWPNLATSHNTLPTLSGRKASSLSIRSSTESTIEQWTDWAGISPVPDLSAGDGLENRQIAWASSIVDFLINCINLLNQKRTGIIPRQTYVVPRSNRVSFTIRGSSFVLMCVVMVHPYCHKMLLLTAVYTLRRGWETMSDVSCWLS